MSRPELTITPVDALGNELAIGDIIFYAGSAGYSYLKAGKILDIYEVPYSPWVPDLMTKYKLQTANRRGDGSWSLGGCGHNRSIREGGIRADNIPPVILDLFKDVK